MSMSILGCGLDIELPEQSIIKSIHEKSTKHISLKIGLDVMKSYPLCRMHLVMHADC